MPRDVFRYLFRAILGLTYVGIGIYIFTRRDMAQFPWAEILSALFVVYGIWRVIRSIAQMRQSPA